MRRLALPALLAVPLLLFPQSGKVNANPIGYEHFGCQGYAFKLFPHIHQHGPLYNYGPYYGYYPFKPYGPWDAYLRYDPFFYGDPYANWGAQRVDPSNLYGWNKNLPEPGALGLKGHSLPRPTLPSFGFKHGCSSCGFHHASWLHGGWFHGHQWLTVPHLPNIGLFHKSCKSCGGVAQAAPLAPPNNVVARYSGFGIPEQSAMFYSGTPALDPVLDLQPVAGQVK